MTPSTGTGQPDPSGSYSTKAAQTTTLSGKHYYSRLHQRLASGDFAVTAEIVPPRGATLSGIRRIARHLREWIDAANITDGSNAETRMASWAGCIGLMREDVEPVMQLQCRDRNRIALQADLLGASAVGIANVLCMSGDDLPSADSPGATSVFDLNSLQLAATAKTLRDGKHLPSGLPLSSAPRWFIGAVENPDQPPQASRAERLGQKVEAGVQFCQTQYTFNVPVFARWMRQVRDLGLDERCYIIAGVGPIRSLKVLELVKALPGVSMPPETERRIRSAPADRREEEAMALCAETIEGLREIEGVRGVHIVASGWDESIPEVLGRCGIGKRSPLPGNTANNAQNERATA